MADVWICTICDETFTEITQDAKQLTGFGSKRGNGLYRWPTGEVHSLKYTTAKTVPTAPAPPIVVEKEIVVPPEYAPRACSFRRQRRSPDPHQRRRSSRLNWSMTVLWMRS